MTEDETAKVAAEFTELCRQGKDREAAERFWSDDVVNIESMPGPMRHLEGKEAIFRKHAWWNENAEMHGGKVEGPFVNGDSFAVVFELDVTMKGSPRQTMREVAVYKVRNGKVVEERFFG